MTADLSHAVVLVFVCLFVSVEAKVPVNNFKVMSGRSHRFLGITSTFGE